MKIGTKTLVAFSTLLALGCSTIRMKYTAEVETKDGRHGFYEFRKSYPVKGSDRTLCWITGIFYGGWCWTYLAMPKSEQTDLIGTDARTQLASELKTEEFTLKSLEVTRTAWDDLPLKSKVINMGEKRVTAAAPIKALGCKENDNYILMEPKRSSELKFDSGDFEIQFTIMALSTKATLASSEEMGSADQLEFKLKNKTKKTIRIIWTESAFVDFENKTDNVMHSGIKYTDKGQAIPPSIIPGGAELDDMISPISRVRFGESKWVTDPVGFGKPVNVGSSATALLTIESNGKKKEYNFKFGVCKLPKEN